MGNIGGELPAAGLGSVAGGDIQRQQHRGNHPGLQHILRAGKIQRNPALPKYQPERGGVRGQIRAYHGKIPIAMSLLHAFHNLLRRRLALLIDRPGADNPQAFLQSGLILNFSLEQLLPHKCQLIRPFRDKLNMYRDFMSLGKPHQLRRRFRYFLKGHFPGIQAVAGEADRHIRAV